MIVLAAFEPQRDELQARSPWLAIRQGGPALQRVALGDEPYPCLVPKVVQEGVRIEMEGRLWLRRASGHFLPRVLRRGCVRYKVRNKSH